VPWRPRAGFPRLGIDALARLLEHMQEEELLYCFSQALPMLLADRHVYNQKAGVSKRREHGLLFLHGMHSIYLRDPDNDPTNHPHNNLDLLESQYERRVECPRLRPSLRSEYAFGPA
jgi:hypothetical protein